MAYHQLGLKAKFGVCHCSIALVIDMTYRVIDSGKAKASNPGIFWTVLVQDSLAGMSYCQCCNTIKHIYFKDRSLAALPLFPLIPAQCFKERILPKGGETVMISLVILPDQIGLEKRDFSHCHRLQRYSIWACPEC